MLADMSTVARAVFIGIGVCLMLPAIYLLARAGDSRRYDRQRTRRQKPVGQGRYGKLWVVDEDRSGDTHTVYVRKKEENNDPQP